MEMTLFILGVICYAAMAFLTADAWRRLRRQQKDLDGIGYILAKVHIIVEGESLRSEFNALNELKKEARRLTKSERYEEARQLMEYISKQLPEVMKHLDKFKDTFGEDCVTMIKTKLHKYD